MAPQHELIGIIEIDAEAGFSAPHDETFALTLKSLRTESGESELSPRTVHHHRLPAAGTATMERVCTMNADLGQLCTDLESELRRFIDAFLAAR